MCHIHGKKFRNSKTNADRYYVPNDSEYYAFRDNLRQDIREVMETNSDEYKTNFGIVRSSILLELPSLDFPRSFPIDSMHCVLLNVAPKLFKIWIEDNLFQNANSLDTIGSAMAASAIEIPTYLGHAPRRIDKHYNGFKAAEWKTWLLYYGAPLLFEHLDEKYLRNFRRLSRIFKSATKHWLTEEDVFEIARDCHDFIKEYEALYYHGDESKLPRCLINIHSLSHFGTNIRDLGPACYWWQFTMERYLGIIKPLARSKSQINASLNNAVILREHLHYAGLLGFDTEILPSPPLNLADLPQLLDEFQPREERRQRQYQFRQFTDALNQSAQFAEDLLMRCFKRCRLRKDLLIGSVNSQRPSYINRNDSRIVFSIPHDTQELRYGEVQYFVSVDHHRFGSWAWIRELDGLDIDKEVTIVSYKKMGNLRFVRLNWILSLIGIVQEGGVNMIVTDVDQFGAPPDRPPTREYGGTAIPTRDQIMLVGNTGVGEGGKASASIVSLSGGHSNAS